MRGKAGGASWRRRAIDENQSRWLSTHLTPQQLERLGQIDLQWEGAAAMLNRPLVAEYLSLTREQQEKVARYIAEGREQRARATWTSAEHVGLTRKAISVLSDKQKDLWIHVLGPPCRFSIAARPQAPWTSRPGEDLRVSLTPGGEAWPPARVLSARTRLGSVPAEGIGGIVRRRFRRFAKVEPKIAALSTFHDRMGTGQLDVGAEALHERTVTLAR